MRIEYNGGRKVEVENEDQAREILENEYPDVVFCGHWELRGWRGEQPIERLLVWENEQEADNDDGSHAVAEIVREVA